MPQLRMGLPALIIVLGVAGCGGAEAPADADGAATSQAEEAAAAQPSNQPERPWMLGLRWQGPADERLALDVQYHLEGQLGTQAQTTTPRVKDAWSYMIGSPWVQGISVAGRMDSGSGPVTVELIRARTVTDSPVISGDDDVEIDAVLGTMTVSAEQPATLQGGAVPDQG